MFKFLGLYISIRALCQFTLDLVILCLAWYLAVAWRGLNYEDTLSHLPEALIFTTTCIAMFVASGIYQASRSMTIRQLSFAVGVAFALSLLFLLALATLFPSTQLWRGTIAVAMILALPFCFLVRLIFDIKVLQGTLKLRVLVMGSGQSAAEVVRFIAQDLQHRYHLAGICSLDNDTTLRPFAPMMETELGLLGAIEKARPDLIVVAVQERRGNSMPMTDLLTARLKGITIMELATFFERTHGSVRLEHLRSSWLVYGEGFNRHFVRDMVKRLFDLLVSSTILLVTAPIMVLAAIAVKLTSKGDVLYRQERVGLGGRTFSIVKFRSMRSDAEASGTPQWAQKADSRVTPIGKFIRLTRIDELPQLFNVLIGDMSFVGPRPERPFFVEQLKEQIPMYDARHSIKPGITGWAQVRAEYGASVEETKTKLEFDLYYLKHHSLTLDLLIILETIGVVVSGRGAR